MLRRFFYASASLFLLALAYQLGASTATAQAPSNPVVGFQVDGNWTYVMTSTGDVYARGTDTGAPYNGTYVTPIHYAGNFWAGATPARTESFGALKAKYR